ncbi:hypothetical protein BMR1_03g03690 [Babesia microti strain RI]|uniref:Uncharacterized protein n=1 Tax=Babesia microti (strain RI) TaxID=1133968 RepID=A0A0K3ARS3_BABMR|nr:hypothetical protein BMR1_03g03690 [Babesia microti strain RI]CTQ41338.1 hypothetical protein BMR1_03g03690 [Babesia microti strain RI]|eukprot:XP_012649349.1 hypothetical protein BMR1_03g03690 [Babesia microti strain RI]
MHIDLENKQWSSRRFSEDDICNFLKSYKLLDIAKYFYNSSSIISPNDYRSLKDIYTSYYSNSVSNGGIRTYNDDFLDYINATSAKLYDFGTTNVVNFSLSEYAVMNSFNGVKMSDYTRYECSMLNDLVLVDNLYWSDDSDEENVDLSPNSSESLDISMAKIGYNAVIQCVQDKQSTAHLKQLIMRQDLVARLESRLRVNIYNNSGLIYNVLFMDSIGLIRLLNSYCCCINKKLIRAHVTIVDGIMIDNVFDVNDSYIVCFLDTISLNTSEPSKLIAIIDIIVSECGIGKNNYNIYHMIIGDECNLSYFTHGGTSEFDILSVVNRNKVICIPFITNGEIKKWLEQWLNLKLHPIANLNSELMNVLDRIIRSLGTTMDKYLICILPVSLSDITLFDERFSLNLASSDTSMHKAIDLLSSAIGDTNVKHILESIAYRDAKILYYNLIGTEKIHNHVPVDNELFNLLDQEISKQNLTNNILGYCGTH